MSEQLSANKSANTIERQPVSNEKPGLKLRAGEPSWLKELRQASWNSYLDAPPPNSRSEEWKRTLIDALDLSVLKPVPLSAGAQADQEARPQWVEQARKHLGAIAGTVIDSTRGSWAELNSELSQKGVVFCTIEEALDKHENLIKPYLEKMATGSSGSKFELMNNALFNGGIFLFVPKGVDVQEPFLALVHLFENVKKEEQAALFPRLIVALEERASIRLVSILASQESTCGQPRGKKSETSPRRQSFTFVNPLMEAHIGQAARLEYLEVNNFDSDIFVIGRNHNAVSRDGALHSLTVALGGAQIKTDIVTILSQPGANSNVQGLVLGAGSESYSYNTIQEHNAPDTKSNITFRVALKDQSSSIYQGTIRVSKAAQRTDAYQSNKNLLLGSEARADSIPRLEILADDVKCSHGATVGPVDKEQIFYLMSRGLSASQAEELIVTGFFQQVLDTCTIPGGVTLLAELLSQKVYAQVQYD